MGGCVLELSGAGGAEGLRCVFSYRLLLCGVVVLFVLMFLSPFLLCLVSCWPGLWCWNVGHRADTHAHAA